ncbi:hypothetical protein K432DRAFT_382459 [Lepidopterella palustris CBS 459.81]|uniref:Uncharacterized protein n=1 Tax=Lepidopterella palustris CBS 459.81 TaxID=1314670 RepID=A0A8E2JF42_9PEZI|nr:hypothetical protein K432DRAFT_382459 [Lepidopterella palustris CBS 459.81]
MKAIARLTCLYVPPLCWRGQPSPYTYPICPPRYKYATAGPTPFATWTYRWPTSKQRTSMPAYCLQDCHYFYRSALRLLSISTFISPLYA